MSIWTIPAPYETLGCFYCVSQRLHRVDTEFLMGERSGAGDLELHVFGADSSCTGKVVCVGSLEMLNTQKYLVFLWINNETPHKIINGQGLHF